MPEEGRRPSQATTPPGLPRTLQCSILAVTRRKMIEKRRRGGSTRSCGGSLLLFGSFYLPLHIIFMI